MEHVVSGWASVYWSRKVVVGPYFGEKRAIYRTGKSSVSAHASGTRVLVKCLWKM